MKKIKVVDYIAEFLEEKNLKTVFAITGAAAIRIIDAIDKSPKLKYICPHHEQAGVMAAIGNYRITGQPGVMVVTAGPGGTNAVTGVASAFLDSIPLLVLAGQEKLAFTRDHLRGKGVQGLRLDLIVKPITKFSTTLEDPKSIVETLEKAYEIATQGRPGPVWIDIPQDLQNIEIEVEDSQQKPKPSKMPTTFDTTEIIKLIKESKRPLIWVGHGVRTSGVAEKFVELLKHLKVPVLTAWNGADILHENHPFYFGRAGIYGNRYSNFILQNCDLLVALGTRLAIPQVGYSHAEFARVAKKVIVEIDPTEIEKFEFKIDLKINTCVSSVVEGLLNHKTEFNLMIDDWMTYCKRLKTKYPVVDDSEKVILQDKINSYHFIDSLSQCLVETDNIVTDMGTSLTCTHAAIKIKEGQRLITSTGLGEMGFGLPCAVGVAVGSGHKRRTIFIGTEGSLMMNIQELQTLIHHKLPIKIFILNNNSYLTIFHTENALFNGKRLTACTPETGVSFPDLGKLSNAFGLKYFEIKNGENLEENLRKILTEEGSFLCNVFMPEDQFLGPKSAVKIDVNGNLFSPPLEDLYPFLSPDELKENMLIPTQGVSDDAN